MPATTKGQIHDIFSTLVTELTTQAAAQEMSLRSQTPGVWNRPAAVANLLDISGITTGFDRTKIGTNFAECVADGDNPGTCGDVISLKIQGDYVAIAERGFRARHCTPVRLMALAAARRKGHGVVGGVLNDPLIYAQNVLQVT